MVSANGINGKRRIKRLIETWVRFGDFLKTGLGKEGVQKAQEEEFLRLKAKIAHLLPVLTVVERARTTDPEALAAVRDITEMLNSFTTLATPEPLTSAETEEIIARWHSIFIFLNRLEGALKDRRYGVLLRSGDARREQDSFVGVFNNWFVRFMISLVIVVACAALVGGLLGITLDDAAIAVKKGIGIVLGQGSVAKSGVVGTQAADSVGAGASAANAKTGAVGSKEGQATIAGPKITRGYPEETGVVPTALKPLVRQYGRHLTMIVFAVFLAGLVFLFFLRVK
jgi:hypothetical protein